MADDSGLAVEAMVTILTARFIAFFLVLWSECIVVFVVAG
jgi:hypothetical protein